MSPNAKMMMVVLSKNDMRGEVALYEAIVRRLAQLEVRGAAVHVGEMGFGSHHKVHHKRLFGVSDDCPVTIMVVDGEERLRAVAPEVRKMLPDGLIFMTDVEIL